MCEKSGEEPLVAQADKSTDIKGKIEWKSTDKIKSILKHAWLKFDEVEEVVNKWTKWSNRRNIMKEQYDAMKPLWTVVYLETKLEKVINNKKLQEWFQNEKYNCLRRGCWC